MIHFFGNVDYSVCAAEGVPNLKINQCSDKFGYDESLHCVSHPHHPRCPVTPTTIASGRRGNERKRLRMFS